PVNRVRLDAPGLSDGFGAGARAIRCRPLHRGRDRRHRHRVSPAQSRRSRSRRPALNVSATSHWVPGDRHRHLRVSRWPVATGGRMASLLNSFAEAMTPDMLGKLGQAVGVNPSQAQKGMSIVGPLLLGSLAHKSQTTSGLDSIMSMLPEETAGGGGFLSRLVG